MHFGGFFGDYKIDNRQEISTPDGNATYSWSIIWEAQKRGHRVFLMHEDRDAESFGILGARDFAAFSQDKRLSSYIECFKTDGIDLPELDIMLVEWRWPINGRNYGIDKSAPSYQSDLDRQTELLHHYCGTKTKIVFWDLDHKLEIEDEAAWSPDAIFETSFSPRKQLINRIKIEPPTIVDDLMQHPTIEADKHKMLVYVGNRYERDDVIQQYIVPFSDAFPNSVEFWGNWTRPGVLEEVSKMWPNISYRDRICTRQFAKAYSTAVACPLIAKRNYFQTGFMTPRIWECVLFGSVPVGFEEHVGVRAYLPSDMIAHDHESLIEVVKTLSELSTDERDEVRYCIADRVRCMDARYLVDTLERI